ncbi:hypothetical protein TRL7639_03595 [Falsiruegeria litorea R37]|uniref:Flagellar FliJ protein n=1 Tax=Falsiruegeria litorea R37 TaxID=1200284 RepID=A0A1Y5THF4_9RHOB|nr:hypothetical protein [Falsiruegeria litorea]SLN63724.1 hypothetical protein TRL7639_03595 [Falsiruegeria litorea R37]
MKPEKLEQTVQVTKALYLREHEAIKEILAQEAEIRAQLARLDAQVAQAAARPQQTHSVRMVGADILWRGWESKTRRQIHTQLAQVQARKLGAMEQLRRAFGRKDAMEKLQKMEQANLIRRRQTRRQDNLLDSILTKP